MKDKYLELIKRLLASSCRGDHMVGLALLSKNRGLKRMVALFDKYGTENCVTVDRLSSKALITIDKNDGLNFIWKYYEGKKYSFYVGEYIVYLVKPNHPHKDSWDPINL